MTGVQHEVESVRQLFSELGELLGGYLGELPTMVAHQVHVFMLMDGVSRRTMPEMGVPDQVQALEQVEGAVDRGDVDRGRDALYLCADLLWGAVLQLAHRVEHQLPLGGHPHPPLVQGAAQGGIHTVMVCPG